MAYCKNCGAYIPDELTACLACGFDEHAEQASAAVRKKRAEQTAQEEDLRQVMHRHRMLQQEKNRQWAEQEKARREQQEENRRWAGEEYARRQAQKELEEEQRRREEEQRRQKQEAARAQAGSGTASQSRGNTALAALSYLNILFALPFFFTPDDEYAKFHAKQGMRLFLFTLVTRIIKYITPFGWIFTLMHLFFIGKGMNNAINGRKEPLPYIGTIGKK